MSDYCAFGMAMPGRSYQSTSSSYRYGFNGMEKDDEIKGEGNSYTTEFRQLDVRLGKWLSVDPLASQFPWQSPYTSMDNNPISLVDPKGLSSESTHTDSEGNVIAVYNDGDNGIYKHDNLDDWDGNSLLSKDDAIKMGESLSLYSFTDFSDFTSYKLPHSGKIDYSSDWAGVNVKKAFEQANLYGIGHYMKNAGTNGVYNIKKEAAKEFGTVSYGSMLYISNSGEPVYASARDAGNFVAGMMADQSYFPTSIIMRGFGAYNESGNSYLGLTLLSMEYYFLSAGASPELSPLHNAPYGENYGSYLGIQSGVDYSNKFKCYCQMRKSLFTWDTYKDE